MVESGHPEWGRKSQGGVVRSGKVEERRDREDAVQRRTRFGGRSCVRREELRGSLGSVGGSGP